MFRADVVVVEHPGLFLGQDDHPSGTVGESFEHVTHVLVAKPHALRLTRHAGVRKQAGPTMR
ncbi:hypothetical protein Aiant_80210 [Actinoplanes ianthinogenes]|uniref:Uncharacterized protein n=1 Tax=Actinoplanes ianthinogenes TaxID=122358 RepID=A0ABN6CUX1_9ACTN|nr:hypothetical protein Aiant_80210 [Actinoplanes ianthinogenes]